MKKLLRYIPITALVVLFDQLSKHWAVANLTYGKPAVVIDGFLNYRLAHNKGAIFGFLAGVDEAIRIPFFYGATLITVSIMFVIAAKADRDQKIFIASLFTIIGGALGNVFDRIYFGYVIDFIDFHLGGAPKISRWFIETLGTDRWHTFNIADVAILTGIGLMCIHLIQDYRREKEAALLAAETDNRIATEPPAEQPGDFNNTEDNNLETTE